MATNEETRRYAEKMMVWSDEIIRQIDEQERDAERLADAGISDEAKSEIDTAHTTIINEKRTAEPTLDDAVAEIEAEKKAERDAIAERERMLKLVP